MAKKKKSGDWIGGEEDKTTDALNEDEDLGAHEDDEGLLDEVGTEEDEEDY